MSPARNDLEWTVLEDFSPGVYDDWLAAGGPSSAPDGALQRNGTFGCVNARGGGLMPAPRRVNRLRESLDNITGNSSSGDFPTGDFNCHITSFRLLSPIWDRTDVDVAETGRPRTYPDLLVYGFEWYAASGGNFIHHGNAYAYKMFESTTTDPGIGTLDTFSINAADTSPAFDDNFFYGFFGIDVSRSNSTADGEDPGYPYVAVAFTSNRDVLTEFHTAYPDDTNPGADSTADLAGIGGFGGFAAYSIFAHQDKIFALARSVNVGIGPTGELPSEILIGSVTNDYTTNAIEPTQYVAENPSGFGSWYSMNSSEAVFIKQQFGGFVLRGDIAFPTVIRLPGLMSTYQGINIGCVLNQGQYLYGSTTGVWAWSGGESVAHMSPQLDGWFWEIPGVDGMDQLLYTKGRFATFDRWVFAPNNYLFDMESNSWWPLTDPDADTDVRYAWWDISAGGFVVGAPCSFNDTQNVIADYYDVHAGQASWQATTQPLKLTRGRVRHFRELDLVAQGRGTITITLIGLDGATDFHSFVVDSDDRPITISQEASIRSHDVVVVIASEALNPDDPAPRLKRLILGHRERETAR